MTLKDAVAYVNARPEPLACYVYTHDEVTKEQLATSVRCGGMTINQINKHSIVCPLPFGGVGASGMGCYHGAEGFKNFSHRMSRYDFRPVGLLGLLWAKVGPNISLPYSEADVNQIKSFLEPLPPIGTILLAIRGVTLITILTTALRNSRVRKALLPVAKLLVNFLE